MTDTLAGTWKMESVENLDDFLKEMGVNIIKRKLAATFKPTIVLESNGDGSWTITRKGGPKQEPPVTFRHNEEFDEKEFIRFIFIYKKKSRVLIESPQKQKHISIHQEHGETTTTREIVNGKMIVASTRKNGTVTCTRVFTRQV